MKRNLLKAIGISFLIFVVLSWIIPVGTYYNGKLETNGIDAIGIFELFSIPISTLLVFILYTITFAVIGGLYGVMGKTGALDKLVENISNKFAGKEKTLLVVTVVFYMVVSSVTGLIVPLFVLVPLSAMILAKLNVNKIVALTSTVGAMLLGSVASTLGFNISGYTKNILSIDMTNQIVAKIILLVILLVALILFVVKFSTKNNTKETKEIKKEVKVIKEEKTEDKKVSKKEITKKETTKKATVAKSKKTTKKQPTKSTKKPTKSNTKAMAIAKPTKKVSVKKGISVVPLVCIFVLMLLASFIGMYNWYYSFEINLFNDIYDNIIAIKIGDFAIFEHLLSGLSQMGYWGNTEFCVLMLIASALIAWIYHLSLNDFVESFIAGVKKMLPTAIYAGLASVILYVLYQASYSGTGTFVDTIFAKVFELTGDFNVITTAVAALLGSFFYNDLYYLLSSIAPFISEFSASSLSIAGLLIQSVYAIGMLLFPTSVVLIAGLSFFDVTYKQWFKYIWKFLLLVFLIVILACSILTVL